MKIPYFFKFQIVHAALYFFVYAIICFVDWKLHNPFQWIIEAPNETPKYRSTIVGCLIVHQICYWAIYFFSKDMTKK